MIRLYSEVDVLALLRPVQRRIDVLALAVGLPCWPGWTEPDVAPAEPDEPDRVPAQIRLRDAVVFGDSCSRH